VFFLDFSLYRTNQELAFPVVKKCTVYKGVVQCTQILQTTTCWRNCRDER
jgi:hypothetical protein